ncbi:MAG: hypothetical protein FWE42_01000 [Defluviitaleaceae bacterium]|nr:hypothetical protein [Defluviitaleaceae bacterium]
MSKFIYEILFGVIGLALGFVLMVLPLNPVYGVLLSGISFLVPIIIIWLRHNIEEALKAYSIYEHFFHIIEKNKSHIVSTSFTETIEDATRTLRRSPVRAALLKDQIEQLAKGHYTVANPTAIFKHNTAFLDTLEKGDTYKSTHWSDLNQSVFSENEDNICPTFEQLIVAHCKAAERGAKISRIYVFNEYTDIMQNHWDHMDKLAKSKVEVKIVRSKKFEQVTQNSGFVIINNDIVGIAKGKQDSLYTCTYYVRSGESLDQEHIYQVNAYDTIFESAITLDEARQRVSDKS